MSFRCCALSRLQDFFRSPGESASMSIEDCDKMINKLIDLQMLELERTRTRSPIPRRSASFEVKPQNAQAAQYALSHGESANVEVQQRVPSASPSSTIAASTPVFARATGSRNRIMAAKVEFPEIAPESSIPLPTQVYYLYITDVR